MNKAVSETELATAMTIAPRKRSKRPLVAIAAVALLGAAALYGRYWWLEGRWYEVTDDAYVGGDTTALSPQVAGRIAEILVEDNQRVAAGQLLLRIDDRLYRAALQRAEASIGQQQATLRNLDARRQLQMSAIGQAEADIAAKAAGATFAEQELRRYQSLATTSAGSEQNAQKAVATDQQARALLQGSRAALAAAKQQIDVLDTEVAEARAALAGAEAERETARLNLGYTEIRAPVDGYVGNRAARVGAYAAEGKYLLSVVPLHRLWVDANFKEDQLAHMQPGQPVTIVADVYPGHTIQARLGSLAPATGAVFSVIPPENATGNFTKIVQRVPVRILLPDDVGGLALRPGLSATVSVDVRPN